MNLYPPLLEGLLAKIFTLGLASDVYKYRVAAKHFCHRPFLLKIEFLTSYGILSRSRRERLLEMGSRGCSEPPGRAPGEEAPGTLWICECSEDPNLAIWDTLQVTLGPTKMSQ